MVVATQALLGTTSVRVHFFFELFYMAKVGTHVEDVLYLYASTTQEGENKNNRGNRGGGKDVGGVNGHGQDGLPLSFDPSKNDSSWMPTFSITISKRS